MTTLNRLALNEEGFVFDPATGDSFQVNQTGLLLLQAFRDGKDATETAQLLTETYEVEAEESQRDVADFQSRLQSLGLV